MDDQLLYLVLLCFDANAISEVRQRTVSSGDDILENAKELHVERKSSPDDGKLLRFFGNLRYLRRHILPRFGLHNTHLPAQKD